MSVFKDAYQKIKDNVFSTGSDPVLSNSATDLDIGPAKAWYIRRLFPKSVFTKTLTPAREQDVRAVFRVLRPEQRAIALHHGWNRGLKV